MFAIEISLPNVCLEAYVQGSSVTTPLTFFGYTSNQELVEYPEIYPLATFCTTRLIGDYYKGVESLDSLQGSVFYDEDRFSSQNYADAFQDKYLNYDAIYCQAGKIRGQSFDKDMFIKSSRDLKRLTGHIVKAGDLVFIRQSLPDDEIVLLSPVKDVVSEYRLFVIGSRIVTSSRYRHNGIVEYVSDTPADILIFGTKVVNTYLPHEHCVIDVAKMQDGGCKLIEFNCINCSAPYASDTSKILKAFASHIS